MFNLSMQCDSISRDQWVSFTVFIVVIKEWNVIWVGFCHFLGGFRVFLCGKFDREQPSGMMTGHIKHQHRHHHRDSKWASCPWRSNWRCWNDLTETNYDQRSSDSNFDLPRYHRGAIYQTQYYAVCRTYSYILSKQKFWTLCVELYFCGYDSKCHSVLCFSWFLVKGRNIEMFWHLIYIERFIIIETPTIEI